jgi:hypothetical protein
MSYNEPLVDFAEKDGLPTGQDAKRIKGAELTAEFQAIADALQVKADVNAALESLTVDGNTRLGISNDNHHVLIGDTYIGYEHEQARPDNSDVVGGTLFLARGALIGRGVEEGTASLGMEQNYIWGLKDPQSPDHAATKRYVDESLIGDVTLGSSNASTIHTKGDMYVGYEGALPDNNDAVGGTLFLARGVLVGRGAPAGTAGIGMESNIIFGLANGNSPDHAVNLAQLRASRSDMANKLLVAVANSRDFDQLKTELIGALSAFVGEK